MIERGKSRRVDEPQPGLFRIRLVRGGPWVAARIYHESARDADGNPLDRSVFWWAEIDGQLVADPSPDWSTARIDKVWLFGRSIDEAEYHHLLRVKRWADAHDPAAPEANPRKTIDLRRLPAP